jgi:GMP synthase-like glutamine amidotransferase
VPVLGICLGSQLLAEALGARVVRNPEPEIGWFPVERAPDAIWPGLPHSISVFHWHEDSWELPRGAVRLYGSSGCANQAFALGDRLAGVQFHPEMTAEIARAIVREEGDTLPLGRFVQPPGEILADPAAYEAGHRLLWGLLDRLASAATAPAA